jgi:hypothetical protein
VIVVEHPFGGGRDAAALVDGSRERSVRREQDLLVVSQARAERAPETRLLRDGLGFGETARMGLQPFDAEDLFPQDVFAVPVIAQRQALENTAEEWVQESAGLLSGRRGALREFGILRAMPS